MSDEKSKSIKVKEINIETEKLNTSSDKEDSNIYLDNHKINFSLEKEDKNIFLINKKNYSFSDNDDNNIDINNNNRLNLSSDDEDYNINMEKEKIVTTSEYDKSNINRDKGNIDTKNKENNTNKEINKKENSNSENQENNTNIIIENININYKKQENNININKDNNNNNSENQENYSNINKKKMNYYPNEQNKREYNEEEEKILKLDNQENNINLVEEQDKNDNINKEKLYITSDIQNNNIDFNKERINFDCENKESNKNLSKNKKSFDSENRDSNFRFNKNKQNYTSEIQKDSKSNDGTTKKNKSTQLFETLLGSKLILTENSNMLIEKPFTIFEILYIIKYNVELPIKLEIIDKLMLIISKLDFNSLIIVEKSVLKDSQSNMNITFINELIEILLDNSREPKLIEALLNLLEKIIYKSSIKLNYFWDCFQRIGKLCEIKKNSYDGNKFLLLLKIINKFFTKTIYDDLNFPSKFMFFNNYISGLKLIGEELQSKKLSLIKGYTIGMWIYPEKINLDSSNKNVSPNCSLFYIHSNKNIIIEAIIEEDKIYYICEDSNQSKLLESEEENEIKENNKDNSYKNEEEINLLELKSKIDTNINAQEKSKKKIYLCDVEYKKWSYLIFAHKPVGFLQKPQLILYKNNLNEPIIIEQNYPNFGNQKVTKLGICKNFTGLLSNVFMAEEALFQSKIIEDFISYKFGLYNEQNINLFKTFIEQKELHDKSNNEKNRNFQMLKLFFKSFIFIYSPSRIKDNKCLDLICNINAELSTNKELTLTGGYFISSNYDSSIYYLGGATIFLPIFDYIFSSDYISPIIFEEGIQILINIFNSKSFYLGNQIKEDEDIFKNLYYLMNKNLQKNKITENNNLFTKEIMQKLIQLGETLISNDKQKKYSKSFFIYILFNEKTINNFNYSLQKDLFKKLKEIYIQNCEYMFDIIDVQNILQLIINLYDNNINYYCCEKHFQMLCENIDNLQNDNHIYNPNLLVKISDLFDIIKYILMNDKIISISQMQNIILILSMEISPCLQISLIKLLQYIFNLSSIVEPYLNQETNEFLISTEDEYINAFIESNGIEHLLYILSNSTLDVRLECLKLFYLFCSSDLWLEKIKFNSENEIIPYICINLFPLKTKLSNNSQKKSPLNDLIFSGDEGLIDENIQDKEYISEILSQKNTSGNNNNNQQEERDSDIEEIKTNIYLDKIINSLSMPVSYIKKYSNKINNKYVEKIYNFLIQWLINRFDNPLTLDDSDEIYHSYILNILMNFVLNSSMIIKCKFLRDLYTLCHFDLKNSYIVLKNKFFHQWLLDLLLIYQILFDNNFNGKNSSHQGLCESTLALGIRLHNTIVMNSILYEQEQELYTSSNNTYIFQFLLTWLYKIKKLGDDEYNSANIFIDKIISDLIKRLTPQLTKVNIIQKSLVWTFFLNLSLVAYEFYYVKNYCVQKDDIEEGNETGIINNDEVINNILENNSDKINSNLLSIYECFKIIWGDEINAKEIINEDIESQYKSVENLLDNKIFGQKTNEYSLEMNIFLFSSEELPFQDIGTNNIMKSIINVIILFIKISNKKNDILFWINELKSFLLYLIVISHNINPQDTSILSGNFLENVQVNIANIYVIGLNFIINELKQNNEKEIEQEYNNVSRVLFICYVLILEKIMIEKEKEKDNNVGFWYGLTSALSTLKNFVWKSIGNSVENSAFIYLYKNIYLNTKNEVLFNLDDISKFKSNNFSDLPQKFFETEWKFSLFENEKILKIINSQFSLDYYDKNTKIRISNVDNIHINDNISYNESNHIKNKSEQIINVVNSSLQKIINKIRTDIFLNKLAFKQGQDNLRRLHKDFFSWKGKWVDFNEYMIKVKKGIIKFKSGGHYTSNFLCPCLFSIDNIWEYLPDFHNFNPANSLFLNSNGNALNDNNVNIINRNKKIYISSEGKNENNNKNKDLINEPKREDTNDSIKRKRSELKNINALNFNRNTNKSNIYFKQLNKNDNEKANKGTDNNTNNYDYSYIEKNQDYYNDIQRLIKYNYLFNFKNYDECIIDLTGIYIEKLLVSSEANKNTKIYNCCLIKLKGHIPGYLVCTIDSLYYIIDYNFGKKQNQKCIGSLFCFDPNKHKLIRTIKKSDIKQIFKKRYYYIDNCLELFTSLNKSYYIKFNTKKERDEFYNYIINSSQTTLLKEDVLSIKKKWEYWDIDTLTFLSFLNNFSSRSFKDLTQYPVFPWIIKDYESEKLFVFNETNIRDLQKPIGALGSKQRISTFIQNFNESKEIELNNQEEETEININNKNIKNMLLEKNNENKEKEIEKKTNNIISYSEKSHYFSSHYSNPFYVVYYMYKLFPYTCCAIELQGDGFDNPERQFYSIINSWNNCMNECTDIRELIPEFYFLPEMFNNINEINFGKRRGSTNNKNFINEEFEYPVWSKNNSSLFVIKNRLALESDHVSNNLNDWVDLIFGYKQKGIEAEKSMNLFFNFTYENKVDIESFKNNEDEYNSLISKVDIGQTPSQIFIKSIDKRLKRKEVTTKRIINPTKSEELKSHCSQSEKINSISYNSSQKELSKKMIIYMKALKNRKILCVYNNGLVLFLKEEYTLFSESGLVFINEKSFKIPSDLSSSKFTSQNQSELSHNIIDENIEQMTDIDINQPILSIKEGKYLIKGGYYDAKFMIHETMHVYSNKYIFVYLNDEAQINTIKTDQENDSYLYIGTTNGKLFIYKINPNKSSLEDLLIYEKVLIHHSKSINDIFVDLKLNLLATVSNDKTCNIYTYPNLKLFRVIQIYDLSSLDNVFISNNPLPCTVVYGRNDSMFYVYTINGSFVLKKKNMFKEIYNPKIVKDVYGRDHLIFGTKFKVIVFSRLPLFTKEQFIEIKNDNYNFPIKCLEFREDNDIIYFWRLHNYNLCYLKNKITSKNKTDNINLYI